ncbi:MAG: glycosyltransferase family 2 protein, partial [Hymenobacteraceae bacterium]|nr:glycosyltransferase family 2 protein [Hymenobacteraceae bacterium]MDX5396255.1 glycosyltransferase family 2 protein [Hymenobacteraceae bacterium]MDX5512318.1 glycosyltransferase family 2 protein [Hymenobacteraceae bacterium]
KVVVVLPAYNAQQTLEQTYAEVPFDVVDEVILVDDCSSDKTVQVARQLGIRHIISHKQNRGYGGNQKTCYKAALELSADIVVMLHPDYQYDPKLIRYFVTFIEDNYFDVMLGSRIRSRREALAGGMPRYKYYGNRFLSFIENLITGHNLSEWHTGMRAFKREVLEQIDFEKNSDDFVFDSQFLFQVVAKGFRIGEIPVPVRYFEEASSINFKRSVRYGLGTLWTAVSYLFQKNS